MRLFNVIRTRAIHVATLALCGLCFGLVPHTEVNAAGAPVVAQDSAFARFMSTTVGAGQETISFGSNGTPVLSPSSANLQVNGGVVHASRTGAIKLPSGQPLPITATAKVGGATMGALIKKALPLVPVLGTGVALYDLAKELGFVPTKNPDGSVTVQQNDPNVCTAAPCYNYRAVNSGNPLRSTPDLACKAVTTYYAMAVVSASATSPTVCRIGVMQSGSLTYYNDAIFPYSVAPSPPALLPSSDTALADAIANKIGWPDSSAVAKALDQAQRVTGDSIPTEGVDVSGPPSVTGPKTVTTQPITNGTRETTKQTNYNCTYLDGATVMDGGTVACTEQTTTTDKDTVTDQQTQQTTVTTTQTSQTTAPADTAAQKPQEVSDPCETNPDRAGCATLDTPEGEIPKVTSTFNYQYEDLNLGNGSCPAPQTVHTSNGDYTIDIGLYCDAISTYVRPVVILFGMLAAFFIAVPVKSENA